MPRVLLLLPTTSYRAHDFLEAARRMDVEVTVAAETPNVLTGLSPAGYLALDFREPEQAAREAVAFAKLHRIDAIVSADEQGTVVGAAVASALGLSHNPVESVRAARDKYRMREAFRRAGVPSPRCRRVDLRLDPVALAAEIDYPCVLKPVSLSGSRGVIRANDAAEFDRAFRRIQAILNATDLPASGVDTEHLLIEEYVDGAEVAVEGILDGGRLRVLAVFDKPDPLTGPFFEESIYVTPSRFPENGQEEVARWTERATTALGLTTGPIHAELRIGDAGICVIEVAARSIGGLCSRTLRHRLGISLEELILRHALGFEIPDPELEAEASGVMMIPIPAAGIYQGIAGLDRAKAVSGIDEIAITVHPGDEMVPLPEGSRYLGFLFSRGATPELAESALRDAHRLLEIRIDAVDPYRPVTSSPSSITADGPR